MAVDANMEPEAFMQGPEVHKMGGLLVRPPGGTCRVREKWTCLDFFIVAPQLEPMVLGGEVLTHVASR